VQFCNLHTACSYRARCCSCSFLSRLISWNKKIYSSEKRETYIWRNIWSFSIDICIVHLDRHFGLALIKDDCNSAPWQAVWVPPMNTSSYGCLDLGFFSWVSSWLVLSWGLFDSFISSTVQLSCFPLLSPVGFLIVHGRLRVCSGVWKSGSGYILKCLKVRNILK